jgi:hypothetical protein
MDFATVFKSLNAAEAELIASQLEAAGFDVTLRNEFSALTLPSTSGVWVQVPAAQAADAQALLDDTVGKPSPAAE